MHSFLTPNSNSSQPQSPHHLAAIGTTCSNLALLAATATALVALLCRIPRAAYQAGSHIAQGRVRSRILDRPLDNYFTRQFCYSYASIPGGVRRLLTCPISASFSVVHVLLLALILCPLSRLIQLNDSPSRLARQRYEHLRWGRAPPWRLAAAGFLIATLCILEYIGPSLPPSNSYQINQNSATMALTSLVALRSLRGLHEPQGPHVPLPRTTHGRALLSRAPGPCSRDVQAKPPRQPPVTKLALIIDSGASFHVHPHAKDLINTRPCRDRISGVDQVEHACPLIGDLPVRALGNDRKEYRLLIRNVRHTPSVADSLISVSQLWSEGGVDVSFGNRCELTTKCGQH